MPAQIDCPRCGGTGHIPEYAMISDGVCFKCGGSGKVNAPKVRKPSAKQIAAKEARDARIKAEAEQYQRDMDAACSDPRVIASPRLRVGPDHPYYKVHLYETYKWHERWGWDAR